MSELPKGWASASVEQLAGPRGLVTDGDWVESKDQDAKGTVRLIQLADIGDGVFVNKSRRFMNVEAVQRLNCSYLQEGDLLVARMPDPLGRACIFPKISQDAVTAVDVFIWRPDPHLSAAKPRWLMHAVNSPEVRMSIQAQAGGTTRQRIAGGKLKQLILPVPPLPEQERIVAKLDSLMGRTTRARAELARVPSLMARYKARLLELGTSGELTSDWRRRHGLPEGRIVRLGSVAVDFSYGTSAKSSKVGKVPVLRMGNIQDGQLDWSDLVFTTSPGEIDKFRLSPGDVLFNRTNSPELVGKTAVYHGEQEAIFAGYLIRIRCGDALVPDYLGHCLNAPQGRSFSWRVKSDGVSQSNINAKKLADFEFLMPSKAEQEEIVRRLATAFVWLDRVSNEHASASTLIPKLDAAVLTKALRGELVRQDPLDEPIEVQLARIRAVQTREGGKQRRTQDGQRIRDTTRAPKTTINDEVQSSGSMAKSRLDEDVHHKPYLANLLRRRSAGDIQALYAASELPVADFYKQLAWEIDQGHISNSEDKLEAL